MEYFTLENDLKEIQASKAKTRKRIFASLTVIVLLVLMRTSGVLTLEYYKAYFQGKHDFRKTILETEEEGTRLESKWSSIKTDNKDFYWNLGLDFKFRSGSLPDKTSEYLPDKEYLAELIEKRLAGERNLDNNFEVSVKKLEMTGLYWFPLVKKGASAYQISVGKGFSDAYSANYSGEIDLEVHGFCTIDRLKKNIAENIAKTVVDSIKDDYKK
jgi:hypothetical protein